MAFAKMVGFEVMPRTPRSIQRFNSPLVIQPRLRLSSHGLCPCCSYRSDNLPMVLFLLFEVGDELPSAVGDIRRSVPELLENLRPRPGCAEVVHRDALVPPSIPSE